MAGSGWERRKVSEVCELIVDCVNKTAPIVDYDTPYRMIRTSHIGNGRITLTDKKCVTAETFQKWTRRANLQPGDVLLTREAPLGEVGFIDRPNEYFLGQRIMQYRADKRKLDPRFLLYSFLSADLQSQFHSYGGTGSTVDHIRVPDCENFELWVPPLPEQKAIASILGALDDKIELNRQMNATLEAMARAVFQSWFVDFDPVRAKLDGRQPAGLDPATAALFPASFQDSPLGPIPRDWRIGRLDEIAYVTMGLSPDGESYNTAGIGLPLINGPVEFGEYFPVKAKWTKEATRTTNEGDLILCVRGSTTGRRVVSDGKYGIGRGVCTIRAKGTYQTFIYQTMDSGLLRLLEKATGSVFPSLSAPDIKGFAVLIPNIEVLNAFQRIAQAFEARIAQNHHQSHTLAQLLNTLLPRLLASPHLPESLSR